MPSLRELHVCHNCLNNLRWSEKIHKWSFVAYIVSGSYSAFPKTFDKQFPKFVCNSRNSLRTWQFHYVIANQIVNFETKLWISRQILLGSVEVRCEGSSRAKFTTSFPSSQFDWQLRNEIAKFVANFGNFKQTSETIRQKFCETHCKRGKVNKARKLQEDWGKWILHLLVTSTFKGQRYDNNNKELATVMSIDNFKTCQIYWYIIALIMDQVLQTSTVWSIWTLVRRSLCWHQGFIKECCSLCRGKNAQLFELQGLQNIELLNLEGNQLSDWKTILLLGHLPR